MNTKLISDFPHHKPARFAMRFIIALGYTALLLVTLLQSSQHPVIGPAAPPGPVPLEREALLTLAHFIGFSLLTAVWWWALHLALTVRRALIVALIVAVSISISTELLQTLVPDRGASWWDIATNTTAMGFAASLIHRRMR